MSASPLRDILVPRTQAGPPRKEERNLLSGSPPDLRTAEIRVLQQSPTDDSTAVDLCCTSGATVWIAKVPHTGGQAGPKSQWFEVQQLLERSLWLALEA